MIFSIDTSTPILSVPIAVLIPVVIRVLTLYSTYFPVFFGFEELLDPLANQWVVN
jgi:hypothetical protein